MQSRWGDYTGAKSVTLIAFSPRPPSRKFAATHEGKNIIRSIIFLFLYIYYPHMRNVKRIIIFTRMQYVYLFAILKRK